MFKPMRSILAVALLASWSPAEGQVCCLAGDTNMDLQVDGEDVGLFIEALIDPSGMDPRALCAADVNKSASIDLGDVAPMVAALLEPASVLFDYGPPRENAEAEQIGLEMIGAPGPLLVHDRKYARIVQDLASIRAAEPRLVNEIHSMAWLPNELIVKVFPDVPHDDYDCLNAYYQVTDIDNLFGDWWVLTLSGNVNIPALAAIYVEAPEVEYAEQNGLIGGQNYWVPTILAGDVWSWAIDDGWWDCFDGCDCHRYYVFETDAIGNVTLISYQEVGMSWCVF